MIKEFVKQILSLIVFIPVALIMLVVLAVIFALEAIFER